MEKSFYSSGFDHKTAVFVSGTSAIVLSAFFIFMFLLYLALDAKSSLLLFSKVLIANSNNFIKY